MIMLQEHMRGLTAKPPHVQIFATDIDDHGAGRRPRGPISGGDARQRQSEERRRRFFTP